MRTLTVLMLLLTLAGCASAEQRRAELIAQHNNYCKSIGVGPGTAGYADCRLRTMQMAISEDNARRQAAATIAASPDTRAPSIYVPGSGVPPVR